MLALSRRPGELVLIGNKITVRVLQVRGDNVWLGICAPPEVAVDREEVALAKRAANARAEIAAGSDEQRLLNEDHGAPVG